VYNKLNHKSVKQTKSFIALGAGCALSFIYMFYGLPNDSIINQKSDFKVADINKINGEEKDSYKSLENMNKVYASFPPASTIQSLIEANNIPKKDEMVQLVSKEVYFPPKQNHLKRKNSVVDVSYQFSSDQNFKSFLLKSGINEDDADDLITALEEKTSIKQLRNNTDVNMSFKSSQFNGEMSHRLSSIQFSAEPGVDVVVTQKGADFDAKKIYHKITVKNQVVKGIVKTNLNRDMSAAGIPYSLTRQFIRLFSQSVDFQRGVRVGSKFELAYETYYDEDNEAIGYGKLTYVMFDTAGKKHALYRHEDSSRKVAWYNKEGAGNKRMLMKTPIDGARLTSGFGSRRHPVLGYTRMHTGVDFAAPTGTPIYAAGDGVVEVKRYANGYGNYIKIRHNSIYGTGYGHMSRFNNTIKLGSHVKQGQVIGYVGSTGLSTGPHLHYEVYKTGRPINPLSGDVPVMQAMSSSEKNRFMAQVNLIEKLRSGTVETRTVASVNQLKDLQPK
jgi:murein DD-endopeptidase MepM/ murein hydrolase activator NlpD